MANISKHDIVKIAHCTCHEAVHTWTSSCSQAFFDLFVSCYLGTSKFFFFIYLVQFTMRRKKVTGKYIIDLTEAYLRTCLFGALYGSSSLLVLCLLRKLLDRFMYQTMSIIPGSVAGITIFLEESAKRSLNATLYLNFVLEIYFRKLQNTGLVSSSRLLETSLFMLTSATLLYLLRSVNGAYTHLWFFVPPRVSSDPQKRQSCHHFGPCWKDITKTGLTHFIAGISLQLLRLVTFQFNMLLKKPAVFLQSLFRKKNVLLGLSACLYASMFKMVTCLLCRLRGEDAEWHAIPAGLAAGTTYYLQPNLTFMMTAVSNIIQIVIRYVKKKRKHFEKIPTDELTFALSSGLLYLAYATDSDSCPSYLLTMLDMGTGGRISFIHSAIEQAISRRS